MIKSSDKSKIEEAVNSTPYINLRLSDPKGNVLIQGTRSMDRNTWLKEKLYSYLNSEPKHSYYCLYGREAAGKYQLICEIDTDMKNVPLIKSTVNSKAEANFDLLQENARLNSKVEILEFQNKELLNLISELEKNIEELEKTIEDLESENVPQLSENQNMLIEFAKPLLPGLQAYAFQYLSQFMPKQPNSITNESTGEITN